MKGKNKFISNLDLKLLGAKFITVPDSHFEIHSNLTDLRKSRTHELPSILRCSSDLDETTLKDSMLEEEARLNPIDFGVRKAAAKQAKRDAARDSSHYSIAEQKQIAKYRNLIHRIKQDNDTLHRQITNLYKEKKLCDNDTKTKPIKQIFKSTDDLNQQHRRATYIRPEAHHFNQIYERLNSEDNPYRKQSIELQKKLSSTNFHKQFEHFLQAQSRRVPEFIKQLR